MERECDGLRSCGRPAAFGPRFAGPFYTTHLNKLALRQHAADVASAFLTHCNPGNNDLFRVAGLCVLKPFLVLPDDTCSPTPS